jgi:putative FmdB family regulatory protein
VPTYQYTCTECGEGLEVVQKFTDDALTVCPNCGGVLRKVFSSVGIVFKGSGFYRTDSRSSSNGAAKSESSTGGGESSSAKSEPGKSESSAPAKSDSGKSESSSSGKSTSSSSGTSTAAA